MRLGYRGIGLENVRWLLLRRRRPAGRSSARHRGRLGRRGIAGSIRMVEEGSGRAAAPPKWAGVGMILDGTLWEPYRWWIGQNRGLRMERESGEDEGGEWLFEEEGSRRVEVKMMEEERPLLEGRMSTVRRWESRWECNTAGRCRRVRRAARGARRKVSKERRRSRRFDAEAAERREDRRSRPEEEEQEEKSMRYRRQRSRKANPGQQL